MINSILPRAVRWCPVETRLHKSADQIGLVWEAESREKSDSDELGT